MRNFQIILVDFVLNWFTLMISYFFSSRIRHRLYRFNVKVCFGVVCFI